MIDQSYGKPLLRAGQILGGCRVVGLLGRGGMAEVYLAEQPMLERSVAVKILPPDRSHSTLVERFMREAKLCSRIEHPNVVTIHNVGKELGFNYIIMQYVEGKNLAELLESHPTGLPWATAVRLAHLAGKGLHAVHQHDLLHRDVKPSNIMLANDGRLLLMDFGLACQEAGSDLTETGIVVGTIPYMAPEQCRGETADRRSDIFSLGSTLYTLLTNKRPYAGNTTEVLNKLMSGWKPPPVDNVNATIPAEVARIVARAMAPRVEDRYQTVRQLNKALADVVRGARGDESTSQNLIIVRSGRDEVLNLPALEPIDAKEASSTDEGSATTLSWREATLASKRNWLIALITAAGCATLAVLMNWLVGGPGDDSTASSASAGSATAAAIAPAGMVRIPAGRVFLGNDAAEIRAHLQNHIATAQSINVLIDNVQQPGTQATTVSAFWIDRYEVTIGEYRQFLQATGRPAPAAWATAPPPATRDRMPITDVTYEDAAAYAEWRGKELPTPEQWVRAFRGDDRRLFPWGNDFVADRANASPNKRFDDLSPVEATPEDVSPLGVFNMAGNAAELLRGHAVNNGMNMRMSKGASYGDSGAIFAVGSATFYYDFALAVNKGLGFRCVLTED